MKKTEFKEKTYEKYFAAHIARLTRISFSPDQTDEEFLGFDDAFFLPFCNLWHSITGRRRARVAQMHGISVKEFEHLAADLSARMPPFKFNLFVQYKRPEFLETRGAAQWVDWGHSYFRYELTPHQQVALEKLEALAKRRGTAVYASPAFLTAKELWKHVEHDSIIRASNIANVGRLRGHGYYTYTEKGFTGRAHSESTEIASIPFDQILLAGLEQDELPFQDHMKHLSKIISLLLQELPDTNELFESANAAIWLEPFPVGSTAEALAKVESFSAAFGTSIYAVG